MRVVKELDAGPVFAASRAPIGPDDTATSSSTRCVALGAELLVRVVEDLAAGRPRATPQDGEIIDLRATRVPRRRLIDWSRSARAIHDICAASPLAACVHFLTAPDTSSSDSARRSRARPGARTRRGRGRGRFSAPRRTAWTWRRAGDALRIVTIQPEGRRPMSSRELRLATACDGAGVSLGLGATSDACVSSPRRRVPGCFRAVHAGRGRPPSPSSGSRALPNDLTGAGSRDRHRHGPVAWRRFFDHLIRNTIRAVARATRSGDRGHPEDGRLYQLLHLGRSRRPSRRRGSDPRSAEPTRAAGLVNAVLRAIARIAIARRCRLAPASLANRTRARWTPEAALDYLSIHAVHPRWLAKRGSSARVAGRSVGRSSAHSGPLDARAEHADDPRRRARGGARGLGVAVSGRAGARRPGRHLWNGFPQGLPGSGRFLIQDEGRNCDLDGRRAAGRDGARRVCLARRQDRRGSREMGQPRPPRGR